MTQPYYFKEVAGKLRASLLNFTNNDFISYMIEIYYYFSYFSFSNMKNVRFPLINDFSNKIFSFVVLDIFIIAILIKRNKNTV
jgi:hypothetical protein